MPPCTPWITGTEVAECCSVETSTPSQFDDVASQASDALFELSGRQFPGECGPKTVRPPCTCSCGYQVLSRGHIIGPWDYGYWGWYGSLCDFCLVSCSPSRVKLSGYPVRAVSQVKIGGDILPSSEYAIYQQRYLTRLNDNRWPLNQDLTLPDTDEHTWSITYTYGADPPDLGMAAAAQLACELWKECQSQACALPKGTTRVTRQGITVDRLAFTTWAYTPPANARSGRSPGWTTGMPLVDLFLNTYNPGSLRRRPVFWAPGRRQYAQSG